MIENNQSLILSNKNVKNEKNDILNLLNFERRQFGYFTAITLPLILAACGGGGGGGDYGTVSPTPDSGGGTDSGGGNTDSGGGSTTAGINANAGRYTATSDADNYLYDVSFSSGGSVISSADGNVIITDFDTANDVITLRGTGAPASFTSGGSSNVDVASDINGDTIITLGSDNNATGSITLKGVSDSSSVVINTVDEAADTGSPKIDLSSGTVNAEDAGEIFEYSVKFLNGVPVAIDGEVTIAGFDAATDRIVLKAEGLPEGYTGTSLINTDGVSVTEGISSTRIDFGVNADGSSGSITIDGVTDDTLGTIDITFEISSPAVSGTRVDIEAGTDVTASSDNETFVYNAAWDGDEVSGSDGDVTISGFSLANDKIIILGASIPLGYDRSQFENNSLGTQQVVVDAINNKTVIYFAPDADGQSSTLTLDGVADEDGTLNIVFGSSIGDEPAPEPVVTSDTTTDDSSTDTTTDDSSTDTTTDDSSTDTTTDDSSTDTTTDDSSTDTTTDDSSTDTTTDDSSTDSTTDDSSASSYTVVNVSVSEDTTITATDDAEEFRYEVSDAGVSEEGAYTVTIEGFDATNDKLTLVIVNGTSNLTTQEFDQLANVEVTSDGISGTQILFAPDSNAQSGKLVLPGVEESFDSDWTATTYTVEIIADSNLV